MIFIRWVLKHIERVQITLTIQCNTGWIMTFWDPLANEIMGPPQRKPGGHHGHGRMVIGITTTYAICAYHHWCCEFESRSGRGLLDATLCVKVCQLLETGQWFSPGSPVSSTNKTDCHDITEILLKVPLSGTKHHQTNKQK
jgi:hypothetical protein